MHVITMKINLIVTQVIQSMLYLPILSTLYNT